jgi:hypothetical protein
MKWYGGHLITNAYTLRHLLTKLTNWEVISQAMISLTYAHENELEES